MRTIALYGSLILLAGCGKPDATVAKDTSTPAAPMGAGAAPISLAAVAGKWTMQTMSATSDTVLLTFQLEATADPAGWTITFPNRAPLAARPVADGDSIVADLGPYESALRKGVQVTTHTVYRLQGAELVGTGTARYSVQGPDSLLHLRMRGTRAP